MLYDALLALFVLGSIPKVCSDRWKKKKKRPTLSERLGLVVPDRQGKEVIWIHAVSVGETKAAEPLFRRLKSQYPNSFFLIINGTATGQAEARRYMCLQFTPAPIPDLCFRSRRETLAAGFHRVKE